MALSVAVDEAISEVPIIAPLCSGDGYGAAASSRNRLLVARARPVMGRQRVAGATVEETIFDDINAWQAQVSKKPPLEEPRTWQGQCLGGETR